MTPSSFVKALCTAVLKSFDTAEKRPEDKYPTRAELMREYELCQDAAQNLESTIWQTNTIVGVGSIGTLVLVATRSDQPQWHIALIIGVAITVANLVWLLMARRWWSIQHAFYIRMRHIAEDLDIFGARYLHFLDNPCAFSESGLPPERIDELYRRVERKGIFSPHQRTGIQRLIWPLPIVNLIAWGVYVWLLCAGFIG